MALDVYAACPCGSHKKLKFCCHGLEGDIERVVRLQSAKQNKQALQLLLALERRHPQSAWVKNLQAFTLMMDRRGSEAKAPLAKVLEQQPDNLYSIALYGLAAFFSDGWKNGKQAIQRAFQRCSGEYPHIIYFLCRSIAEFMGAVGSPLAHRQYLAQAMRLANEEDREQVFMELIEFDGETKVPYMLRGSHDLVQVSGDEAFDKEVRKAFKLSFLGCQEAAAGFFTKLAEAAETKLAGDPGSGDETASRRAVVAGLWWDAGLCRAWDGDERSAAEAIHKSARFTDDFETAVERETLAQSLERRGDRTRTHRVVQRGYKVQAASKLLSTLDQVPLVIRVHTPDGQQPQPGQPVATYRVLDQAPVTGNEESAYTLDRTPRIIADVVVFDRQEGAQRDAALVVMGIEGELFQQATEKLEAAAGGEIEFIPVPGQEDGLVTKSLFEREYLPLQWRRYFEPSTPQGIVRRVNRAIWRKFIDQEWPETPTVALGDKTPRQAAGDDSLRVPLAAWLLQLDMHADRAGLSFDVNAERAKLGLPAIQTLNVTEQTNVGTLSILQFARVPFERLNDTQLLAAYKRATLIQHKESLRPLLTQIVERTSCHDKLDLSRVYRFLSDLGSLMMDPAEAVRWLDKERSRVVPAAEQFEHELDCDMRELRYRLDNPHDTDCNRLLHRLWEHYGPKVPEVRSYVAQIVHHYQVPAPWMTDGASDVEGVGGAVTSAGIWTPDAAVADEPAAAGKLWLPGQS